MDDREFHDRFYDGEAERIFSSPLYRALLDQQAAFLVEVTPGASTARILSIGCGDGERELALAPRVGRIVGVDVSRVAVARARQRALALGIANVEFNLGDGEGVAPHGSPPFDAVWCAGVLHHLPDAQIAPVLRSARAALRPGGRFVSMDPNALRAVNLFKPLLRRTYDRFHSPEERELRPRAVVAMLRSAAFRGIEVRFTDFFISPLAWAFPRLTGPIAPLLAGLDQLLVKTPGLKALASGFAVIGERGD